MELQVHRQEFRKRGLDVAAVSYDSVAVLRDFAARRGIGFPLLSDQDSSVIRAFGIFNETSPRDSYAWGVPYPGTYVLDASGVVTAKYFEEEYTDRVTASDILVRQFGATPSAGPGVQETRHLRLTATSSATSARGGQKIALILTIELKPGMHVYAPGVQGYKPVEWEMFTAPDDTSASEVKETKSEVGSPAVAENPNRAARGGAVRRTDGTPQAGHASRPAVAGDPDSSLPPLDTASPAAQALLPARLFTPVSWPEPKTLRLKAIGETVPVYEKRLRLVREVTIPSDHLLREATSPSGVLTLDGVLRYQACDSKTCYNPVSLPVSFAIQILRHDTDRVPEPLRRPVPQR